MTQTTPDLRDVRLSLLRELDEADELPPEEEARLAGIPAATLRSQRAWLTIFAYEALEHAGYGVTRKTGTARSISPSPPFNRQETARAVLLIIGAANSGHRGLTDRAASLTAELNGMLEGASGRLDDAAPVLEYYDERLSSRTRTSSNRRASRQQGGQRNPGPERTTFAGYLLEQRVAGASSLLCILCSMFPDGGYLTLDAEGLRKLRTESGELRQALDHYKVTALWGLDENAERILKDLAGLKFESEADVAHELREAGAPPRTLHLLSERILIARLPDSSGRERLTLDPFLEYAFLAAHDDPIIPQSLSPFQSMVELLDGFTVKSKVRTSSR